MIERNTIVDIIRGFAMLLVVLGHTLSGSTSEFQNSLLFQIIWTLQMPLFIIISGYVTRYSKSLSSAKGVVKFIKKRTLAYLLPWGIWTFLVRGFIFGEYSNFDIGFLFWHMDCGYWFLITIWTIAMIFGIADYISNKVTSNKTRNILCHFVICGLGIVVLGGMGYVLGLSFFCIKLTLYYLPIYLIGYLYGQLQDTLTAKENFAIAKNISIAICLCTWLTLITRIDFFGGGDSGLFIILRFVTSIIGCCAVIGLFTGTFTGALRWVGVHSLEIYLSHYLFLNMIKMREMPALQTLQGTSMLIGNYVLTLMLTVVTIRIMQKNDVLNYLLYGKQRQINS